jgi:serine protease Do
VLKRTERALFLDVGYDVLTVPAEEVLSVTRADLAPPRPGGAEGRPPGAEPPSEVADEAAEEAAEEGSGDSIFHTARLEPGTIEEKAREVSESVVQILCLGKTGSGFVVDDGGGYVVTNFHVIEKEQNISAAVFIREEKGLRRVRLESIRIVALNPFFDLALLKIEDRKDVRLKKAYLGDYARVRVGDPVFAIGAPLGLDRTVSEGIVSNRNRALEGILSIQTTAPINPGNSGGPLFNDRGEVIGVTSSKILGGENLGFAIPVHFVKDFLRNHEAYAYDRDNPNTGVRYLRPPSKSPRVDGAGAASAASEPAPAEPATGEKE